MSRIASSAIEYRYLPVTVDPVDGEYPVLVAGDVAWKVTGPDHDGTLHDVDVLVAGSEGTWYAGVLIGTGGLDLAAGTYRVRAVITDAPETVETLPDQWLVVQ